MSNAEIVEGVQPSFSKCSRNILFWPTVGAILSGAMPGVGLYRVLIFSNIVCGQSLVGVFELFPGIKS